MILAFHPCAHGGTVQFQFRVLDRGRRVSCGPMAMVNKMVALIFARKPLTAWPCETQFYDSIRFTDLSSSLRKRLIVFQIS